MREFNDHPRMRKSIAILICIFFLIDSGFFVLTYYPKLSLIKEHAREKISLLAEDIHDPEIVLLKISIKEMSEVSLYKELNDGEFIYKGNLYDLISKQDLNDTLYVYCLHDLDEENFHETVCNYFNTHKEHDNIIQTVNTVQAVYLNFIQPQNSGLYPVQDKNGIIPINFTNVLRGYFTISDPPPRFIS